MRSTSGWMAKDRRRARCATLRAMDNRRFDKLSKRLRREVGTAIADYAMIEAGDRVMVCLSGGKDSYTLLEVLMRLREKAPVPFELAAVHLDQKQPGYDPTVLPTYLGALDIEHHIIEQDTYSIVTDRVPANKTMCGLCSRLRRGILYRFAREHGFTKIALGHHRDDIVETLFLNMFFGSKLKTMPPRLPADDGYNTVIRPLAYSRESDIAEFSQLMAFPIMPCNLCGSQENLQRQRIKSMLHEWEREQPGRVENVFRSLSNIVPSHLLDRSLHDFVGGDGRAPSDAGEDAEAVEVGEAVQGAAEGVGTAPAPSAVGPDIAVQDPTTFAVKNVPDASASHALPMPGRAVSADQQDDQARRRAWYGLGAPS